MEVDNRIYNLARKLCKNLPEDTPEGFLYGYLKMASMNKEVLSDYLSKGGVANVDETVNGINESLTEITERGLDVGLLKATDFTSATEKTEANSADNEKRRPLGFGAF